MSISEKRSRPGFAVNPAWRTGFDPNFLGVHVPAPVVSPNVELVVASDGSSTLRYTRFSVQLNAKRRLAQWIGWNIDGTSPNSGIDRTGFRLERRIKRLQQWGDELYVGDVLEQGHVAKRADLTWGDRAVAIQANYDSSYYPNIVPHARSFHRSATAKDWGDLEQALEAMAKTGLRITLFGGPILQDSDPPHPQGGPGQIPVDHWKVLAYMRGKRLFARGFVLTQDVAATRNMLDPFDLYRKPLKEIGELCSLRFPDVLVDADTPPGRQPGARAGTFRSVKIESLGDIDWFQDT